ncbi:MAG: hypothetical protein R6W77_10615 [Trueperaceae bacterium]
MTRGRSNTWLAVVMIGVGALALVGNVGWFGPRSGWAWGIAFGLVGAAFLALYARERGLWWALFPGFAALGLAAAAVAGSLGGALFLALAAAAFVGVFLTDRRRSWAIVPGGVLATLALMALLEAIWPRAATDWLLFTGLAVTFAVMYLRPAGSRPNWALQIAIGLVALAVVAAVTGRLIGILVAIALIALGGYFAWRAGSWVEPGPVGATRKPPATTVRSTMGDRTGTTGTSGGDGAPGASPEEAASDEPGADRPRWFTLRRRAGRSGPERDSNG